MLISHIHHCLESWNRDHNLRRGTTRQQLWHSWKVNDNCEEMVMATVRLGDYVQTMGRQAATWGLWSASPFERGHALGSGGGEVEN